MWKLGYRILDLGSGCRVSVSDLGFAGLRGSAPELVTSLVQGVESGGEDQATVRHAKPGSTHGNRPGTKTQT